MKDKLFQKVIDTYKWLALRHTLGPRAIEVETTSLEQFPRSPVLSTSLRGNFGKRLRLLISSMLGLRGMENQLAIPI